MDRKVVVDHVNGTGEKSRQLLCGSLPANPAGL
jgi:hypothetical protein